MIDKPQAINRVLAKRRIGNLCTKKSLKSKLNKLKKRKKNQRQFFNKYLETQKEELSCLICRRISIKPTLLSCGHLFCFRCINEFIQKSPVNFLSANLFKFCPNCSTYIFKRKLKKCKNVENLLKVYFRNSKDEEECEERMKIEEESSDYLDNLRIKEPKIGMKIDVRDTGCVWCVGEITKVIWNEGEDEQEGSDTGGEEGRRKRVPYVKLQGWDNLYDEYLKSDSSRIRPLGYYTSKEDMPRYANVSSDSNLLFSYIEDGRARARRQHMQEEQQAQAFMQNNQNPEETLLRRLIERNFPRFML